MIPLSNQTISRCCDLPVILQHLPISPTRLFPHSPIPTEYTGQSQQWSRLPPIDFLPLIANIQGKRRKRVVDSSTSSSTSANAGPSTQGYPSWRSV